MLSIAAQTRIFIALHATDMRKGFDGHWNENHPSHRSGAAISKSAFGVSVTSDELDELLPDRWLAAHPDCKWQIDDIRREGASPEKVAKATAQEPH